MTKTNWTPGPWVRMNSSDIFTGLGAKNAEGTEAANSDGWMIADCDAGSLSLDEVAANARLIAAAPDLYEALTTLLLIVGLTAFKHEGQREVLQKAVDQGYEALQKANNEVKA